MRATPPRLLDDLRSQPWLTALLLAGIALSFFAGLGSVPLFDLDEGAFSEATREMLLRGDYISTFLNGEPRYDKPVLVYWLQAVSVLALGETEFAFRLPSAVCATLWVVFVLLFVRRVRGIEAGLVAACITATAAGITVIGRAAIADALLNMLIVAAMSSAWLYLHEGDRRWLRASFVAIGFGLLAKGPVAIVIPAATTFLYCLSRGELRRWFDAILDPAGIALMLVIAAPWYAAQYAKEGDAFVRGFLLRHNVERFGSTLHGFRGGYLYYVPWLFVATLPFLGPLVNVLRAPRRIWADDLGRFCALWFGFVFVLFSFSGTKLPHYVFYGYTGLFILMALHLPRLGAKAALLPAVLPFAAMAGLPHALDWWMQHRVTDPFYREAFADVRSLFGPGYYAFAAAAAAGVVLLVGLRRATVAPRLAAAGCATAAALALFILPLAGRVQQAPVKEAALLARARGYDVVMWGVNTPSFLVYSGRLAPRRDPRPGEIALTKSRRIAETPGLEVLYRRYGIALVRVPREAP